jgi:hypothetical protein
MNAVLIISILLLLALTAFFLYRWQRKLSDKNTSSYITPPRSGGLFGNQSSISANAPLSSAEAEKQSLERRTALISRAAQGDQTALNEAQAVGDTGLYQKVLDTLVARASGNDENLRALASHIIQRSELRASARLAAALIEAWQCLPNKRALAEMLHIAALSDDAAIYQQAVETVLQVWRNGRLPEISSEELYALIENQYWMLASEAKRSGAGFVLKRRLVSVRRELAAAARRASNE